MLAVGLTEDVELDEAWVVDMMVETGGLPVSLDSSNVDAERKTWGSSVPEFILCTSPQLLRLRLT